MRIKCTGLEQNCLGLNPSSPSPVVTVDKLFTFSVPQFSSQQNDIKNTIFSQCCEIKGVNSSKMLRHCLAHAKHTVNTSV